MASVALARAAVGPQLGELFQTAVFFRYDMGHRALPADLEARAAFCEAVRSFVSERDGLRRFVPAACRPTVSTVTLQNV